MREREGNLASETQPEGNPTQRSGGLPVVWTFLLVVALSTAGSLMAWRAVRGLTRVHEPLPAKAAEKPNDSDLDGAGFGSVAPFALVDESGKPFDRSALEGKVWIADFIFTYCAGPCIAMSAEMETLRKDLADAPDARFVSFSVDPNRDTPEILAKYAESYGGAGDRWHLLTGSAPTIYALARGSFLAAAEGGEVLGDPKAISHSERFFLVDRDGVVRGRYSMRDPDALARLRQDARRLLQRGRSH